LEKITKAGGKVTKEKTEIGNDFGFYALFEDNSGNLLGIWSQKWKLYSVVAFGILMNKSSPFFFTS